MASSTRISVASPSQAAADLFAGFLPKISWQKNVDGSQRFQWLPTTLAVVISLLLLEQYVYRSKKKHLPGATYTIPVIGKFFDSITPSMDKYKKTWQHSLSVASVFNIFIVIASDNKEARKVFNSPMYTEPCLVASMKQILVPTNWVFLNGRAHADYRKGLNVLFTRRAMAIYLKAQEYIRRQHFAQWHAFPGTECVPMMPRFRDLNMETSLYVFCGDLIAPKDAQEISDNYKQITAALDLVNFPLALPGTKVYKAIQARKIAVKHLANACRLSKQKVLEGKQATSLVEKWNQSLLEESGNGTFKFTDQEQALTVLSFIFASQDAMTSSLTSMFMLVADNPHVLQKIRAEQDVVRRSDFESDVTIEQLDEMPYTRAVVKETLRIRPPVIMVPYLATKDYQVSDDYTAPKGTILCPSFWNSTHDPLVYPDPDAFMPERWLPGGNAEHSDPKNYLVFGAGPHKCIGNEYVYIHMAAVISSAAALMDWKHEITPLSYTDKIVPTIFPRDDCLLRFTPRDRS